jgi:hypothetical protein
LVGIVIWILVVNVFRLIHFADSIQKKLKQPLVSISGIKIIFIKRRFLREGI